MENLLTIKEAAEYANVTPTCVLQWIEDGRRGVGRLQTVEMVADDNIETRVPISSLRKYLNRVKPAGRPSRLTNKQISQIRALRKIGTSQQILSTMYGVSESYISYIVTGKRKPAAGGPILGRDY